MMPSTKLSGEILYQDSGFSLKVGHITGGSGVGGVEASLLPEKQYNMIVNCPFTLKMQESVYVCLCACLSVWLSAHDTRTKWGSGPRKSYFTFIHHTLY